MPPRSRSSRPRPARRRPARRQPQRGDADTPEQVVAVPERPATVILSDSTTVPELSELVNMTPSEIIGELFRRGIVTNINTVLDFETAAILLADLQIEAELAPTVEDEVGEAVPDEDIVEPDGEVGPRPPVVTVMGHVDHGKTSLLDAIRKARVAAGEVGGITQSIGAYQVDVGGNLLTFIDTPGHEAFTAMRARGADITDIVVLVVAADDGVMPQTQEAIGHARAAGVPIVVAVNKMDLESANPQRLLAQLATEEVLVESHGGSVVHVEISAEKGDGLDELLEMILLTSELDQPTARLAGPGRATVMETRLDRSMGPLANVLVTAGEIKVGDSIVVGSETGKVRALLDPNGERVERATPSQPVVVMGLGGMPKPGDLLAVVEEDGDARQISESRRLRAQREDSSVAVRLGLEDLAIQLSKGQIQQLDLIVKADTDGSVEAVVNSVEALGDELVKANVVYGGVGNITETDVNLAVASKGVIIGFGVKANPAAEALAENQGVDIRPYRIIYELIEDVKITLEGMIKPEIREVISGRLEIRGLFRSERNLKIVGGMVTEGALTRGADIRVMRAGELVGTGKISSLRRFIDVADEVTAGYECGMVLSVQPAIQLGDLVEAFHEEEFRPVR
jgi:translation initiation factor IF-2